MRNRDNLRGFWSKVDITPGCWLWLAGTRGIGYGRYKVRDHGFDGEQAHRYSYYLAFGPIPAGVFVCHKCDVPACVNPGHLFLGTHDENVADKVSKGRQVLGERVNTCRLKADQVSEILLLIQDGMGPTEIGRRYGVDASTVCDIKAGRSWKSVPRLYAP